jgi:probable rRNA maturation factor
MQKKPTVNFSYADVKFAFSHKNVIKQTILSIFEQENKTLESIQFIFCSDEYLLNMNKQFLEHDFYTDIITFDLTEGEETIGEIYISIDRVVENAVNLELPWTVELHRVIFHGALHLCGYKDKTKREISIMRDQEEYYLRLIGEEIANK